MDVTSRIEQALAGALAHCEREGNPPGLAAAMRHAVFPGGARVRPRLCLAVAAACGGQHSELAEAAAASIELLHCASLVHDDLPCFDDAVVRRGQASVHAAFGERLAVLAGDGLIVLAFETLARGAEQSPERAAPMLLTISRAVGAPHGIVAGQAWECEPEVSLAQYHRAKTGSLFTAATAAGAIAAAADPAAWTRLGDLLGEAYQVADDIRDVACQQSETGKPVGRDAVLGRPNAARELGLAGAIRWFQRLVAGAIESIPQCSGGEALCALMRAEAARLVPEDIVRRAA